MSTFAPQSTPTTPPDPTKHVNFTRGMVLGEDDFRQEFAYHAGRDRWLARSLGGYGTVWGLQIVIEDDGVNNPRVSVKPGAALSPQGQMICVSSEQCALLNAWLSKQTPADLATYVTGTAPNQSVKLYVTLCYRDCPVDNVPIPGEPCRSEDDAMAASRLQDDYLLELRFQPPEQFEEDGLRDFVGWLRQVPLEFGAGASSLDVFLKGLRNALHVEPGATPSRRFIFGSPDTSLKIPTDDVVLYWRAAFRVWTTEFRSRQLGQGKYVRFVNQVLKDQATSDPLVTPTPIDVFKIKLRNAAHLSDSMVSPGYLDKQAVADVVIPAETAKQDPYWQAAFEVWDQDVLPRWISKGGQCAVPTDEECVLLAELTVPLTAGQVNGNAAAVIVEEDSRPYVLHQRVLQEWNLTVSRTVGSGPNIRPDSGPDSRVGEVSEGADAKHIDRLLGKAVDAAAPADRQVLTFDEATDSWRPETLPVVEPPAVVLDGDVVGSTGATTVSRLQGVPVASTPVKDGQVLTVVNGQWQAAALPARFRSGGDVVIHGAGLPTYAIAAAGLVRGDGSSTDPVYNGLRCTTPEDGLIRLEFGAASDPLGYRQPDGSFQYVVKVLPVFDGNSIPEVAFFGNVPEGIELLVMHAGARIPQQELSKMAFMVEVSYFEK